MAENLENPEERSQTEQLNKKLLSSFMQRLDTEPSSLHSNFTDFHRGQEDGALTHPSVSEDLTVNHDAWTDDSECAAFEEKFSKDFHHALHFHLKQDRMMNSSSTEASSTHKPEKRIVGIGGVSCGGKTTMAKRLSEDFKDAKFLFGDDYYHDMEHCLQNCPLNAKHNYPNFDVKESMDLNKLTRAVVEASETYSLVVVESVFIYCHKPLTELVTDRYFVTLDKETCRHRRTLRTDYDPPPFDGYFAEFCWPEYQNRFQEAADTDRIRYLDSRLPLDVLYQRIVRDLHDPPSDG